MLFEVAPLQVRRTVFIPPTLRFEALSVNGAGAAAQYLPPVFKLLKLAVPPPHDHFAGCPDRRVTPSVSGRIGGAGNCPTVGAGIVPSASGEREVAQSTRDDRFAVGPHCCVKVSAKRDVR
jgi:hypothetical protein